MASLDLTFLVLLTGKTVVNLNYTASRESLCAAVTAAELGNVLTSRRFLRRLEGRGIQLDKMLEGVALHYMEDIKDAIGAAEGVAALAAAGVLPAGLLAALFGERARPRLQVRVRQGLRAR